MNNVKKKGIIGKYRQPPITYLTLGSLPCLYWRSKPNNMVKVKLVCRHYILLVEIIQTLMSLSHKMPFFYVIPDKALCRII